MEEKSEEESKVSEKSESEEEYKSEEVPSESEEASEEYTYYTEEESKQEDKIFDSGFDKEPSEEVEMKGDDLGKLDVKEYGYSFWLRYLTTYPSMLVGGK